MKRAVIGVIIGWVVLLAGAAVHTGATFAPASPSAGAGARWMERHPSSPSVPWPHKRQGATLAYDSQNQVVIMYGGFDHETRQSFDDTWIWNGTDWTELPTPIRPPASGGPYAAHSMAYDRANGKTVLFVGGETWTLTYNGTTALWEQQHPTLSPSGRWGQGMAHDIENGVTILFGGYDGSLRNDTWEWDGTTWTPIENLEGPLPEERSELKLAYMGHGQTLLYGGHSWTGYLNSTWIYGRVAGRRQWTALCSSGNNGLPACGPDDRSYHFMSGLEPDSMRILMFGGYDYRKYPERYDETWIWDGPGWTAVSIPDVPTMRPSRRLSYSANGMVYDEARGEVVLFGGQLEPGPVCAGDTWVFPHANRAPVANAGFDQTVDWAGSAGTPVTLDGSAASDPDGDPLTYTWTGPFPEGGGTTTGRAPTVTLPLGVSTITLVVNDGMSDSAPSTVVVRVVLKLTGLGPAVVWVGLKNSDDVGTRFDLRAEVLLNGVSVGSGESNHVLGGSSGFNNAVRTSIPISVPNPVDAGPGSLLAIKVSVHNTCFGRTHNSGAARLWFNDAAADSRVVAPSEVGIQYLLRELTLGPAPGAGPRQYIDVAAGSPCSAWKTFGTWSTTIR
jgi:hypothetical protein